MTLHAKSLSIGLAFVAYVGLVPGLLAQAKPAAVTPSTPPKQEQPAAKVATPKPAPAAATAPQSAKPSPPASASPAPAAEKAQAKSTPTPKAAAAKTPAAKPAAAPAPAAGTPASSSSSGGESEVKVARRDPFESLIGHSKDEPVKSLPPGIQGLMVSSLRLDGVVRAPSGMIAVVTNPQSRTYFLREGDQLYDGRVEKINMDNVSFHEMGKDAFGKPVEREVDKRIYPSPGEQQ